MRKVFLFLILFNSCLFADTILFRDDTKLNKIGGTMIGSLTVPRVNVSTITFSGNGTEILEYVGNGASTLVVNTSTDSIFTFAVRNENSGSNATAGFSASNSSDVAINMFVLSPTHSTYPNVAGFTVDLSTQFIISADSPTAQIQFYVGDEMPMTIDSGGVGISTITVQNGTNILFNETLKSNIGQYQANRPYKIYVASEVVVGNSIRIGSDNIFSTTLNDNIVSVSTSSVIFSQEVKMPKKVQIEELEVMTKGLKSHGNIRGDKDIRIEQAYYGTVFTSSSNYKYMLWIDDNGNVFTTQIAASPEISFEERKNRINTKLEQMTVLKNQYKAINKNSLKERLDVIEQILQLE